MTWLDNLGSRGGALVEPARRLLENEPESGTLAPRRGADGLIALADLLEGWCAGRRCVEYDEDALVEAAGALLGLILIDHAGSTARHTEEARVHRVQLGEHGYFDPFRAVQLALESNDPRRQLAIEVARRCAHASPRGDVVALARSTSDVELGRQVHRLASARAFRQKRQCQGHN